MRGVHAVGSMPRHLADDADQPAASSRNTRSSSEPREGVPATPPFRRSRGSLGPPARARGCCYKLFVGLARRRTRLRHWAL